MRKPMSKTLRFNVFKRDQFTCQYCGRTPPGVILEVDHITPVADGGENDIDNLATACFDCNRGKADVPLYVVPTSLADRAALVAEKEAQLRGYHEIFETRRQRLEEQAWQVCDELFSPSDRVTNNKFNGVLHFVDRLGVHRVLDAVSIAKRTYSYGGNRAFKYFCGICWRLIREEA